MRRGLLVLALAALAAGASAATATAPEPAVDEKKLWDPKAIHAALQDFMAKVGEYMDARRDKFEEIFAREATKPSPSAAAARRRLAQADATATTRSLPEIEAARDATKAAIIAAKEALADKRDEALQKFFDMLAASADRRDAFKEKAGDALDAAVLKLDATKVKVADFLRSFFGDVARLGAVPVGWLGDAVEWAAVDVSSSLQEWAEDKHADLAYLLSKPETLREAADKFKNVEAEVCEDEDYTPKEKVPTKCTGPKIAITLKPKKCTLDSKKKELACTPASLVLTKTPGACALKHFEPATWTGKTCKLGGAVGLTSKVTIGGRQFDLPLDGSLAPADWASLWGGAPARKR